MKLFNRSICKGIFTVSFHSGSHRFWMQLFFAVLCTFAFVTPATSQGTRLLEKGNILTMTLRMHLNRVAEWQQMFDEAWRYERDYFYDPNLHGQDWQVVRERYAPLVPFVRHRADLTYILD